MEFAEILALIKKAIFLVGGACVVILLYYRYGKTNRKITQEQPQEPQASKDGTPVVNVRRCEPTHENPFIDPSEGIEIDPQESEWIRQEKSPVDELFMDEMPQERRQKMIQELRDMGYTGTFERKKKLDDTDMNADPFED